MVDLNPQPEPVRSGFVANEPVVVAHFVLWLFINAGAFVVGHTHLVTQSQWSSLTTGLAPFVTALVLSVIATVVRKKVLPAWKKYSPDLTKLGLPVLTPEQLDLLAQQIYESFAAQQAAAQEAAQSEGAIPQEILAQRVPAHAGYGE